MTCHEARELFSALLDEALDPDESGAVDAHVATCVDCRRELGLLRNTVALVRRVEPVRAPAGFVDRVRRAARPAPWYRRLLAGLFLPWAVKLPLGAAAAVLVGVIAGHLFRTTPELQETARVEPPGPEVVTEAPPPQEPPARPGGRAKSPADQADAARRRDLAKAAPATAPAPGPAAERKAESSTRAAAPAREPAKEGAKPDEATSRLSTLRATRADVSGRLVVKDREAAARALTDVVAKAGGAEVARSAAAEAMVIELTIPRTGWAEFTRELAALGTWTPDREPAELPAEVRVALQIVE
jgi:hypothetical protein